MTNKLDYIRQMAANLAQLSRNTSTLKLGLDVWVIFWLSDRLLFSKAEALAIFVKIPFKMILVSFI